LDLLSYKGENGSIKTIDYEKDVKNIINIHQTEFPTLKMIRKKWKKIVGYQTSKIKKKFAKNTYAHINYRPWKLSFSLHSCLS
jgi:hypothetical protein